MNSINIIGRLTRDMSLKKTTSGTSVISGAIAYNEVHGGENVAMFFDFVAYGRTADLIDTYFHKGDEIGLSGKLTQRSWTGKDGQKRSTVEIQVNEITFMRNDRNRGEVQKIVEEDFKEQAKNKLGDIDAFAEVSLEPGDLPFT